MVFAGPLFGLGDQLGVMVLFVMLNFTSSGGVLRPELQPGFFGALHASGTVRASSKGSAATCTSGTTDWAAMCWFWRSGSWQGRLPWVWPD